MSDKLKIMQEKLTGPNPLTTNQDDEAPLPETSELVEDKGASPQDQVAG